MIRATVDAAAVAVALRSGCAQSKGTLPVLACALLEADAEGLRITTTDLQVLVAIRIGADVAEHGKTCARADLLAAAMTGGGNVELVEESGHLVVKRKPRSRVRVETLPPDQWPAPDNLQWQSAGLDTKEFARAVNTVAYAAARNDVRPFCNAICVSKDLVAATNGHRMAVVDAHFAGTEFMVPIEAATFLRRALAEGGDIELGGAHIKEPSTLAVVTDRERVEIRLLQRGGMPNFHVNVPHDEPRGQFEVDVDALRNSVKRIRPFCETKITAAGKISLSFGARMRLDGEAAWIESGNGESRDDLPAESIGGLAGGIADALDITYLASFLDGVDFERVRIAVHGDKFGHKFVLRDAGRESSAVHVIMGMRL